jgi:hypothetical protein
LSCDRQINAPPYAIPVAREFDSIRLRQASEKRIAQPHCVAATKAECFAEYARFVTTAWM